MQPIPEFIADADGYNLEAIVNLPEWAAMGGMIDYPRFRHLPQDGSIVIQIRGEDRGLDPLSAEERAIAEASLHDTDGLLRSLLDETFLHYPALRAEYLGLYDLDEDDDDERFLPVVKAVDDLRPLIRPIQIHLHLRTLNGVPYVGVEAQSTWDQEHGLGILLNGGRVVDYGAADVAGAGWKIDHDITAHTGTAG